MQYCEYSWLCCIMGKYKFNALLLLHKCKIFILWVWHWLKWGSDASTLPAKLCLLNNANLKCLVYVPATNSPCYVKSFHPMAQRPLQVWDQNTPTTNTLNLLRGASNHSKRKFIGKTFEPLMLFSVIRWSFWSSNIKSWKMLTADEGSISAHEAFSASTVSVFGTCNVASSVGHWLVSRKCLRSSIWCLLFKAENVSVGAAAPLHPSLLLQHLSDLLTWCWPMKILLTGNYSIDLFLHSQPTFSVPLSQWFSNFPCRGPFRSWKKFSFPWSSLPPPRSGFMLTLQYQNHCHKPRHKE